MKKSGINTDGLSEQEKWEVEYTWRTEQNNPQIAERLAAQYLKDRADGKSPIEIKYVERSSTTTTLLHIVNTLWLIILTLLLKSTLL